MNKWITTILVGLIFGLAAVIGAVDRADVISGGSNRKPLVGLARSLEIDSVVLRKRGAEVQMEKVKGNWFFISPIQDRIDPAAMGNLLNRFGNMTLLEELSRRDLQSQGLTLAQLGLEGSEALELELSGTAENGKTWKRKFFVGLPTPRIDSVYIQLSNRKGAPEKAVNVVSGNPLEILDHPYDKLRERRLMTIPPSLLTQIAVKRSNDEFAISRAPNIPWRVNHPVSAKADLVQVDNLLATLQELQSTGDVKQGTFVIPQEVPEGAALFQFRFGEKNALQVYLQEAEEQPETGFPNYLAVASDRPGQVFELNSDILYKLPRSSKDLRDRRLIQNINYGALNSIGIWPNEVELQANHLAQGRIAWDVRFNDKLVPADNFKVNELLTAIQQPVIVDFIDGGKWQDYNIPEMRLGFNFKVPGLDNPDGSPGDMVEQTQVLGLGWRKDVTGRERLYASFKDDPSRYIYQLDEGFAVLMPTDPVKWRSTAVMNLSHIHVESIRRQTKAGEDLQIDFDLSTRTMTSKLGGEAVDLNPGSVVQLRDALSSLRARSWVAAESLAEATNYLKDPYVTFTIKVREFDSETKKVVSNIYTLRMVEAPGLKYYGLLGTSPDAFELDGNFYRMMIRPLGS